MAKRERDDFEELAGRYLVALYGEPAIRWNDDGSRDSMFDVELLTNPAAAVEVVSCGEGTRAHKAEIAWREHVAGSWAVPGLTRDWTLVLNGLDRPPRMKTFREMAEAFILGLEANGVFEVRNGMENADFVAQQRDPDVAGVFRLLRGGMARSRAGSGSILVALGRGFQTPLVPDTLADLVPDLLDDMPDVLGKLASSGRERREPFLVFDGKTNLGWGTGHWAGQLPSRRLDLPAGLTGCWLAGMNSTLWHHDTDGWRFHDMTACNREAQALAGLGTDSTSHSADG